MRQRPPCGIDLGTTYSAIATLSDSGKPELLRNREGERITPSVVWFDEGSEALVGRDAKRSVVSDAGNVVQFVKRFMGQPDWRFSTATRRLSASQISSEILKKLAADAATHLGGEVDKSVITVPAYFGDRERTATLAAAKLAGFQEVGLLNEPTAAALAYDGHHGGNENLVVYDLGGGTFDVSIVEVSGRQIRVLATDGDVSLGGKDWDDCIIAYSTRLFRAAYDMDPTGNPVTANDLRERCERAKEQLSQLAKVSIRASFNGNSHRIELTRQEFEALTAELLAQTQTTVELVLRAAGLRRTQIDRVLLVGGSTRMPQVRTMLTRFFDKAPFTASDADEAVAKGAAIHACSLYATNKSTAHVGIRQSPLYPPRLRDVTAHSLGTLAHRNGSLVNSIVLRKNSAIPADATRSDYVTTEDNQTTILVPVLQGEDEDPELCDVLAAYELSGIPARPAFNSEVEVSFRYDINGVVSLIARDIATGRVLDQVKREIRLDEFRSQASAAQLDIMFTFDTTGSMYGYLELVRNNISQIITEVHAELPDTRIAIMAFGDHCDESSTYLVKSSDFMKDTGRLKGFLRNVERTGGGDAPEAIEDALWSANRSDWAANSSKALVLIGDAPSHDKTECPYHRDFAVETQKLCERGVRIYSVLCGSDAVARRQFKSFAQRSGGKFLPLNNITDLCDLLVAVAMRECGRLDTYRAKLLSENRMTSTKRSLLEILDR